MVLYPYLSYLSPGNDKFEIPLVMSPYLSYFSPLNEWLVRDTIGHVYLPKLPQWSYISTLVTSVQGMIS